MESMHGAAGKIRLAVLDGDGTTRELAGSIARAMDHPCATPVAYHSFEPFYAASTQVRPDVMIVDLETLGQDGHLSRLAAAQPQAMLMAISPRESLSRSLAAMEAGAHDVISLPIDPVAVAERIDRFLIQNTRTPRGEGLRRQAAQGAGEPRDLTATRDPFRFESFVGGSARMREVYDQIRRIAPSSAPVFITGESGSGKELAAAAIHARSPRAEAPFIVINCAAIPGELMESEIFGQVRGAFTGASESRAGAAEAADGGTLFLDEIGEMDLALQSKLLRFVQTGTVQRVGDTRPRPVDVRILCATNRGPHAEIAAGRFREDLFYRLHVLPIRLPALRDRREDILPLAQAFLTRYAREEGRAFAGVAPCAGEKLLTYDWPGNVRQLRNIIERTLILTPPERTQRVEVDMLPSEIIAEPAKLMPNEAVRSIMGTPLREARESFEREYLRVQIRRFSGNISRTAVFIGMERSALHRKLKALGLSDPGKADEEVNSDT